MINRAVEGIDGHRNRVGKIALLRALAGIGGLATLVLLDLLTASNPVSSLGQEILKLLPPPEESNSGIQDWISELRSNNFVHWLVGSVGAIIGLYAIWQVIRLWGMNRIFKGDYKS